MAESWGDIDHWVTSSLWEHQEAPESAWGRMEGFLEEGTPQQRNWPQQAAG